MNVWPTDERRRIAPKDPYKAEDALRPLKSRMVLSVETTLQHPRRGLIKLEDTVAMTEIGHDVYGDRARGWNRRRHGGSDPVARSLLRKAVMRSDRNAKQRANIIFPCSGRRRIHFLHFPVRKELIDPIWNPETAVVAEAEAARPALCDERGLRRMDRRRASRRGDEPCTRIAQFFVGREASKLKISVALAEDGRQGEVRFLTLRRARSSTDRAISLGSVAGSTPAAPTIALRAQLLISNSPPHPA